MSSKKKNGSWASDDDANDLLAGILDETEEDARSEQERIEAKLEEQRRAEEREKAEALERKRAEAKARITAEEERLEGLEKRRTMRQEALRVEDLKERGEWVEDEPETADADDDAADAAERQRELEAARRAERERMARQAEEQSTQSMKTVESDAAASRTWPLLALAAVFALVAGAAVTAVVLVNSSYEPDGAVYSKSVYEPREPHDMQVLVGFTPVHTSEATPRKDEGESRTPSRPAPSQPSRTNTPEPTPEPKEEAAEPLVIDEDGFDPFSEGF